MSVTAINRAKKDESIDTTTEAPTWTGEWHPFAERFPMYSEERLRRLADGIKEVGQLNPCIMTPDGLGLDGRNRVAACRIAGVEPRWAVVDGNPWTVILNANVQTRDLTIGQRAMATAVELNETGKRKNGRFQRGSVPEAPDNGRSAISGWAHRVKEAGIILDWKGELADEVLAGTLALDAAYKEAMEERDRKTVLAEKMAQLPSDLAALVEAGAKDLDEAVSEARHRSIVDEIDRIRDGDGSPPPSFAERAESGSITWAEAARLARGWQQDREESIERDRRRIRNVVSGWGTVQTFLANPENPYVADTLEGLDPSDREAITTIIDNLKGCL